MNIWEHLKNLVYRPEFFAQQNFLFRPALRFYAVLILAFVGLQILATLPGTIRFFQTVFSEQWQEQKAIVQNIFPEELVITVTNGAVSTNTSEPIVFPIPQEWRNSRADMPENLVVIDTTKPIETSDFTKQDTALIISEYGFGYHDFEKGEFRIYDTRDKDWRGSFTGDKAGYDGLITKLFQYLRVVIIVGTLVMPFLLYGMFFIGILVYLVFGALLVWAAAKVRNFPLSYGQAYVAALYLLPVPLLYDVFLTAMPHDYHGVPFAFSFILFIVALINFPKITAALQERASVPSNSGAEAKE